MTKPTRNIWWLILGISGLSTLGWFTNSFEPTGFLSIGLFLLIIWFSMYSLALFLFSIKRRALLLSLGITIWLILRLLGLRELYYGILLLLVILSLEKLLQHEVK